MNARLFVFASCTAAICFCVAPLYVGFMLAVFRPSQYEAVLSVGAALLLFLTAVTNLGVAFSRTTSRGSWLIALAATGASGIFMGMLSYFAGRPIAWVLSALVVLPAFICTFWALGRLSAARATSSAVARA
jgi:hypothetical protein